MNNEQQRKRLFFGLEVFAPWPERIPPGRILDPLHRHITLAFLGEVDFTNLLTLLREDFPKPSIQVGLVGSFDDLLFLPPRHPHVVSWHIHWLDDNRELIDYQKRCVEWFQMQGFDPHVRGEFLPHVTICRSPFDRKKWEKAFKPLPLMVKDFHLYESVGQLKYEPVWSYPLRAPFEEIEHTADMAFKIFGENMMQIYHHAVIALAFTFPPFFSYQLNVDQINNLEDVVILLNQMIAKADGEIGCPFKAVSYHGHFLEVSDKILEWEMIIDV